MRRVWSTLTLLLALPAGPVVLGQPEARAQAAPATGPVVSAIQFTGDVQDRDRLLELSTIKVGKGYAPQDLRETISAFFQKGLWSGITADERRAPDGTVQLTFNLVPQLLLGEWDFKGNRTVGSNVLARAMDLEFGDPINPNAFPGYIQTIRDRYVREGFFDVKIGIDQVKTQGQMGKLVFSIDEGEPLELTKVHIISPGPLSEREVMDGLGVKPGHRLPRDAAFSGLDRLEKALSEKGWLNSHLSYYFELPDGTRQTSYATLADGKVKDVALAVAVEAGQKALVAVDADEMLPTKELANAITVYKNRSYSPAELDASAEALRALYVSKNHPDAEVTHAIARQDDGSYLITFTVDAGPKVTVKEIAFQGNRAFTEDQLRKVLQTQPPRPVVGGGAFVPEVWEADMANVVSFYETQGFLDAKVTAVDRLLDDTTGRLTLVVHLQEGPRTLISRLLFKGTNASQEAGVLQALPINPGDAYNPRRMGDYIASVEAYFAKTGYPAAKVTGAFEPGQAAGQGALVFNVQPGPKKRIGNVILRGNLKTHDAVVRRQIAIGPGDLYNSEELLRTQQQIYQLGFFDRVNIGPLRPITADPKDPVELVVDMHERETGSVGVGGGYGDLQGPQASAEYVQTNLFGSGRPLRMEGLYSQRRSDATFTLRDPFIFGDGNIAELGAGYLRDRPTNTLDVETYGPTIGLSRQLAPNLISNIRYGWGRTHYYPDLMTPNDFAQTGGLLDYANSLVTGGITYDNRSDLLNPRWGTKTELALDVSTRLFGGTLFYTRPRVNWAYFIPFPRQLTLALGAELGYLRNLQGGLMPPDILFRTGGGNTLRGYSYNEVGVNGTILGGEALAVSHVEGRFPLFGDLGGVLFSDAGNVWNRPGDISLLNLKVSAGVGLRYYTPIGPIRVDYAARVYPEVDFGFGQGWSILGRNLYFGIGHAF